MANISVEEWLQFFKLFPSTAPAISSFIRTQLFENTINEETVYPQSVEDSFNKAYIYFRLPDSDNTKSISAFLNDSGDDLHDNLLRAIHLHQIQTLCASNKRSNIEAISAVLMEKPENYPIKSILENRKNDRQCNPLDDYAIKRFLSPLINDIEEISYYSTFEELNSYIKRYIDKKVHIPKKIQDQENYQNQWNCFFADDFYDILKKRMEEHMKDHPEWMPLSTLAKYCGYGIHLPFSGFIDDLKYVYKEKWEDGLAVVLSEENTKQMEKAMALDKKIVTQEPKDDIKDDIKECIKVLKKDGNLILQGAPGVGKTYISQQILAYFRNGDESRGEFTTFHQSLDYEDFIEGIRVKTNDNGTVSYVIEDGIFKKMAKRAISRPNENFLLVIDEINRGNVSKIFGELISLIEFDKREFGKYPLHTTLPYSRERFIVPSNLFILGTMNTTDRSVGRLDYALRRRFSFRTIKANKDVIKEQKLEQRIMDLFEAVKKYIEDYKTPEIMNSEDIMVGHSYFKGEIEDAWENKILPLLEEYINDGLLSSNAKDPLKECKADSTTVSDFIDLFNKKFNAKN